MNNYQKELIVEHSDLVKKIKYLHAYIYGGKGVENDDKVEYANKCIQLSAMKKYEEALYARMQNAGVVINEDDNQYYTRITNEDFVPKVEVYDVKVGYGSDYDADSTKLQDNTKE